MSPAARRNVAWVAGIVVAGFVIFQLLGSLGGSQQLEPESSTTVETSATPTSTQVYTEHLSSDAQELLKARVEGFLEAYFQIEPNDTEQVRQKRVEPYIHATNFNQVLARLDFPLATGSEADAQRMSGEVDSTTMALGESSDGYTVWVTDVMVELVARTPDGEEVSRAPMPTTSRWVYISSQWYLLDYFPGGEVE